MKQSVAVIICAGGKGLRAGFEKNKLLAPLQGERVLKKTISAFDYSAVDEIVVVTAKDDYEEVIELCAPYSKAKVTLGGETRSQSVYNGLQAVTANIVLIHDGARPFVTREMIDGCIQSVKDYGSGICAIPTTDTIAVGKDGKIIAVPDRNQMYSIQTPQGFYTENIRFAHDRALENGETEFTDDSSLFLKYCGKPHLCAGARDNIKLTYAQDFDKKASRCGFGVDTHAFGKEQDYIILAGVKIPSQSGLIAHSDGDVLVHALMDALLSGAGLRDIGFYFPDSNAEFKNADSMKLLNTVLAYIDEKGYCVENVSIAIQAEKPRLAPYIETMQNSLAVALKIDPTTVGITAGTNEGLGYVGEGKGITVHAYVSLKTK